MLANAVALGFTLSDESRSGTPRCSCAVSCRSAHPRTLRPLGEAVKVATTPPRWTTQVANTEQRLFERRARRARAAAGRGQCSHCKRRTEEEAAAAGRLLHNPVGLHCSTARKVVSFTRRASERVKFSSNELRCVGSRRSNKQRRAAWLRLLVAEPMRN